MLFHTLRSAHPTVLPTMGPSRSALVACGALLGGMLVAAPALGMPQARTTTSAQSGGSSTTETSESSSYSDGSLTVKVTKHSKRWTDEEGKERSEDRSEVRATLDGKEVPADRIRVTGDRIEILDASGEVIRTAPAPQAGGATRAIARAGGSAGGHSRALARSGGSAQGNATSGAIRTTSADAPKVMLGVTMETPDEGVAQQLKLAPSEATIIMSVTPDLPAAKAGLKRHDVIVSVDGSKPASPQRIREVMRSKEPGSTMKLGVVSGGESRELTVTLEPWDAERLGLGGQFATMTLDTGLPPGIVDPKMQEQIDAMMQQFRIQFEGLDLNDPDAIIDRYFTFVPGGDGRTLTFVLPGDPNGQPMTVGPATTTPGGAAGLAPTAAPSSTDERIRQLEDRIERLNETIRLLEERLKASEPKR